MRSDAKRAIRDLSRTLFGGAQYRLEVACAIATGSGVVCIKELAEELGDPPGRGSVNTELKKLEKAGLLVRHTRTAGERRVLLERQDCAYWSCCQELAARASQPESVSSSATR
jgi:ABC-type phosphate transport system ATPase subunit